MNDAEAAVKRMIEYIRANLRENITAKDVATAARYSQYHAARVFKEKMGLSPFEYIRKERLTQSAYDLRQGKARVLDVALDYVFDSHEGFTRAFTKAFGINPGKYANYPAPKGWRIPYWYHGRKTNTEECEMEKTSVIFTQIIERPKRKLILKRAKEADNYFDYCYEVGCGENGNSLVWDALTEIKEALYEPVGVWLPENMRPKETGEYAHGLEVAFDFDGKIPEGFEVIDLEPCKLIVFQGEPFDDEDFMNALNSCMENIRKFNPEVYGYEYAPELAPRMQLRPEGWRGYIEMFPVRERK